MLLSQYEEEKHSFVNELSFIQHLDIHSLFLKHVLKY